MQKLNGMKEIRKEKKITFRELGKLTGISFTNLSQYENGKMQPSIYKAAEIAKALGCTVDKLLEE